MSKRRRKVDPEAVVKRMMRGQLKDFRKKFGRDALPGEPVFFDPDKDEPTELTEERVRDDMMAVMSGGPPHLAYAYAKTGLMLMEGMEEYYDPDDVAEYKAAIDEYFRLEAAGQQH
jgi:hypothetical protein